MRSYGQYCAAARALDVVGDRWSLLIVRELLLRDCRFADLRTGLPGIATNLLTDRLRALEGAGVLERHAAPPPVATVLYRLTDRGRALEGVLAELALWGVADMARGAEGDVVCGHWVALAAPVMFRGADLAALAPLTVALDAEGTAITLTVEPDGIRAALGAPEGPADVHLAGTMHAVMGTLLGAPGAEGLAQVDGDREALRRLAARSTAPLGLRG
ncbi:winged helix-turn-helix transcriptional regulator [Paraconexibacter algicola]|uniref:winged helix-turn-helix transcriptional regulator n=1 Tax=Paraconexibacter algicola TaxID=2133960 RepID=UPI0018EE6C8D|nr:helix-turn-helix domain-containing protein [Paraconexibacter algicola]